MNPFDLPGRFYRGNLHTHSDRSDGALEPEALLAALKAGHYYSSQGPTIHGARLEAGVLHVECSPVKAAYLAGAGARSTRRLGSAMTRIALEVAADMGGHMRLTLVDAAGRRAWTNPFWL